MPWAELKKMDQRVEFAIKSLTCSNFQELCRSYGISRKTGYKWRNRFIEQGMAGAEEQSRRPHCHSDELTESVVCDIVRLKQAHPNWGPRKIRIIYGRKLGINLTNEGQALQGASADRIPSESSFKRVLERSGLTVKRVRKRSSEGGRLSSGRKGQRPNEVWTVDFKGWWLGADSTRVDPLTVRDECSRMLLELRAVENAKTDTIKVIFERLFEAHGIPDAMRSDNGPPFASPNGLLGLSRLSVWWLALGIDLERSRPACPQDNGAHERMHLDVRRELQAGRIGRDQQAFDLWRHEFNHIRPHESLGMKCPADVWVPSTRTYSGNPDGLDYEGMETRKVSKSGIIMHFGAPIFLSSALAGWDVGLNPCRDSPLTEVRFVNLLMGHIDPATASFRPASAGLKLAESSEIV
jgi:transposase InsO family protein